MRHQAAVRQASFSPDGALVATVSDDGQARLWSTRPSEPAGKPMMHDGWSYSVRFSQDGAHLVTASYDRTARLWNVSTGEPVGKPMKHKKRVYFAAFSPEGARVVTTSADGTARLWDARTGEPIGEPMNFGGFAYMAEFSRDGQRLLTASADKTALVWDVPTATAEDADLLASVAETIAGCRLDEEGAAIPVDNPITRLGELRRRVAAAPVGGASGPSLVRWVLANRDTRTISPFSPIRIDEYIRQQLAEGDTAAVRKTFPGHPLFRMVPGANTAQ